MADVKEKAIEKDLETKTLAGDTKEDLLDEDLKNVAGGFKIEINE